MSENTLKCSPSADVVCGFPGAECRSVAATVPREWAGRISISDNHLCSINRCFSRGDESFRRGGDLGAKYVHMVPAAVPSEIEKF